MEARLEIEPGLARLAAAKASPEALTTMRLILRRLGASEDHETMERWDGAFHRLIAETVGTLRARRSNRAHCGGAPHPQTKNGKRAFTKF
jgi:DNA-binding GntR family transcriptional regulator